MTKKYEELMEKQYPEIIEETRGISNGSGVEYKKALLVLLFWETKDTTEYAFPECSSFVATGEATVDGNPVATQNSD